MARSNVGLYGFYTYEEYVRDCEKHGRGILCEEVYNAFCLVVKERFNKAKQNSGIKQWSCVGIDLKNHQDLQKSHKHLKCQ